MEHPIKKKRREQKFNGVQKLSEQTCLLELDLDPHSKPLDMETFQDPVISEANLVILEVNLFFVKKRRRAQRMCLLDSNSYSLVERSIPETFQDPIISEANLFSKKKKKKGK